MNDKKIQRTHTHTWAEATNTSQGLSSSVDTKVEWMVARVLAPAQREQQQWQERRTQQPWNHHQGLNREDDQEVKPKNIDEGLFVSLMLQYTMQDKVRIQKICQKKSQFHGVWKRPSTRCSSDSCTTLPVRYTTWTQSMTKSIEHNSSWIQCIATVSTALSETTNWHKNPSASCQPHRFNTWQQQRGKDKEKKLSDT